MTVCYSGKILVSFCLALRSDGQADELLAFNTNALPFNSSKYTFGYKKLMLMKVMSLWHIQTISSVSILL